MTPPPTGRVLSNLAGAINRCLIMTLSLLFFRLSKAICSRNRPASESAMGDVFYIRFIYNAITNMEVPNKIYLSSAVKLYSKYILTSSEI